MYKRLSTVLALGLALCPGFVLAQDAQTLADVRQELTVVNVEMQKLRRELSTTGAAAVQNTGGSVLERVNAMESELQRLTSKTEELENRINNVVADGTNRIGDLNFRLCELEAGCDIGNLPEMTPLGGEEVVSGGVSVPTTPTDQSQLAVNESADFTRAQEVLASGDFRTAADQFATFNQTYPGSPLAAEADLRRGEALTGLGDVREAARAYLASFSADPTGPVAPQSLYELGRALGVLGQTQEACVTLGEVAVRFPDSNVIADAEAQKRTFGCQ